MLKNRKTEIWLLILWNIPAYFLSYLYGSNYIITALLFFTIPSIYISFCKPKIIKKSALVSIILIIPLVSILSYFAHTDGSWYNPSIVGIRFMDTYPIEDFLWGFLYCYYIITVYEYFFEREKILRIPKKFIDFEIISLVISAIFSIFIFCYAKPIIIPYTYALIILVFALLLPALIFLFHPRIFKKAIYTELFFLPLSLMYEYVANIKENWLFPGHHFIGYVPLLNVSIPLEEMFWLLLIVPAVVAYYEFLATNDI